MIGKSVHAGGEQFVSLTRFVLITSGKAVRILFGHDKGLSTRGLYIQRSHTKNSPGSLAW